MKHFSSQSGNDKNDPLFDSANNLLHAAQVNAISMFKPLLNKFPILQQVEMDDWDYILTIAGVFIAASRLRGLNIDENRENGLMEVIAAKLNEWNCNGINGFEDCKRIFESEFDRLTEQGHEIDFVASDALGIWIVFNIFGQVPQTDEGPLLVRTIGGMVVHAFYGWWE